MSTNLLWLVFCYGVKCTFFGGVIGAYLCAFHQSLHGTGNYVISWDFCVQTRMKKYNVMDLPKIA